MYVYYESLDASLPPTGPIRYMNIQVISSHEILVLFPVQLPHHSPIVLQSLPWGLQYC